MFEWLKRFGKDERGNVMFITAFAAFPLLIVSFGALDFVDTTSVRQNLQRSADEAVLAAIAKRRSGTGVQRREARRFFIANLADRNRYKSVKSQLSSRVIRGRYVMEYSIQAKADRLFAGFSKEETVTLNVKSYAEVNLRKDTPARLVDGKRYDTLVRD